MDDGERLARLEELFRMPEVTSGFPSKQAGLSWANHVAPLLSFNPQYHHSFLHYLQIVTLNVSNHTAAPAFRNMLNQVEMAIEELKHRLASPPQPNPAHEPNELLNKLLRGEGSVAEKTRIARALDDDSYEWLLRTPDTPKKNWSAEGRITHFKPRILGTPVPSVLSA